MGTKTQKLSNVVDQIVEWQSVVVADGSTNTTAVAGRGYFVDTSAGAHTVNLPASPKIGDVVRVSLLTPGNSLTIGRNGNNINGNTSDITTSGDGDMFELVYVNASEGWKTVGTISAGVFISATGGTITTSGDYKIHTFTGDGCFVVSSVGNSESNPLGGPSVVDYLVVAGGGSGGSGGGVSGGGGAGGFRASSTTYSIGCAPGAPLTACVPAITVSATTYPVTVGGGGAAASPCVNSNNGSNSVFSTITSAGGGGAGGFSSRNGSGGGSGGGGGAFGGAAGCGGSGNTPPVNPPQGNPGNPAQVSPELSGGGGGAISPGPAGVGVEEGGNGAGLPNAFGTSGQNCGSYYYFSGGGSGSIIGPGIPAPAGGLGGGGVGGVYPCISAATAGSSNTGGGGGGGIHAPAPATNTGGAGGKGIVIIRYKFQ
jgi:hypothetical protein